MFNNMFDELKEVKYFQERFQDFKISQVSRFL